MNVPNFWKMPNRAVSPTQEKFMRSVDLEEKTLELDALDSPKIEKIKDTKVSYTRLLELTSALAGQLTTIKGTHKAMSEVFNDLTRQQPELMGELSVNGSVYHHITDQSDTLIKVLSSFADSLKTLVTQTIQVVPP